MATAAELPTRQHDGFFTNLGNQFKLIGVSWQALVLNFKTFVFIVLIPTILFLILFIIPIALMSGTDSSSSEGPDTPAIIFLTLVGLAFVIYSIWSTIALTITQIASARGQKVSFKDINWKAWSFFWRTIGLAILCVLVILAGFILLIVPGLLAMFFLFLAIYVMVDKNLGIVDSMKISYQLTKANWKVVLAFIVLLFLINVPQVVPILGGIVTLVLSIAYFVLQGIIYVRIADEPTVPLAAPLVSDTPTAAVSS